MANFNKVYLMGNLTRDPEMRYTPSGVSKVDPRAASSNGAISWNASRGMKN